MPQNIPVVENILNANDRLAEENHARIEAAGVFSINIIASPGAGKTSLIERTDRIISAAIRAGPDAVGDARLWTSATYEGPVGVRLASQQSWSYPGETSAEGFALGSFNANQEKSIEIKINLPSPPGRPGENLIPLRIGNGGAPG